MIRHHAFQSGLDPAALGGLVEKIGSTGDLVSPESCCDVLPGLSPPHSPILILLQMAAVPDMANETTRLAPLQSQRQLLMHARGSSRLLP